ncbi:MAG: P1 family peptidase [Chloroflexi bacterium]|nr:P1 family peptidase [Chloroflexota bacterium]
MRLHKWLPMIVLAAALACAQTKPRGRELGIRLEGTPGPLNAITDVAGVEVGHRTIISGANVRTGVTAVWPRGKQSNDPVFGGFFSQNGNGDMTGTHWLEESGFLDGPVLITNTHSVGVVRDAYLAWLVKNKRAPGTNVFAGGFYTYPVVAETYDGFLNDINGFHVKPDDVSLALESAAGGAVPEGNVGGGTGMVCHEFKGGIGTASRVIPEAFGGWTVGVLVQANYGRRGLLRVDGVPVGEAIPVGDVPSPYRPEDDEGPPERPPPGSGSIIVIVATDAPLLPHQCERLAQRAGLGIARMGGTGGNSSGDLFLCFATGNRGLPGITFAADPRFTIEVRAVNDHVINGLFEAVIESTEEAILNALVAAETMTGRDGITAHAIPHDRLIEVMERYGRSPTRG